jgi:hypothetical protein
MFDRRFFLVAPSFHGATLLAKLLNAHPQIVSLADTYPSNRFDQICGCGTYVSQCRFWKAIKARVGAQRYISSPSMLPIYPKILDASLDRYLYNVLPLGTLSHLIPRQEKKRFRADYRGFLQAVYDQQDGNRPDVFVDGVKSVSRILAMIASGEGIDGVIHLVRSPSDFVKSSMKGKGENVYALSERAYSWRIYHNRAYKLERYAPYVRVSYERLTDYPDVTIGKILEFLGVSRVAVGELLNNTGAPWHFVGNASLFDFDARIHRSRHSLGRKQSLLVRIAAGRYCAY